MIEVLEQYMSRRMSVADQDLEEGAAAGWSEEEMAADSPSVASYEASNNTFNSSPPPAVPDPMAAAVQRDGVLTSTPQSQRSSDLDQGYNSRQSSQSSIMFFIFADNILEVVDLSVFKYKDFLLKFKDFLVLCALSAVAVSWRRRW